MPVFKMLKTNNNNKKSKMIMTLDVLFEISVPSILFEKSLHCTIWYKSGIFFFGFMCNFTGGKKELIIKSCIFHSRQ